MTIDRDYKFFLENILGLMVINAEGNVIYMNRQCADYIKMDQEKSIGKYITDVFPPSNMQKLLTGDKALNTDFYFYDGRMSVSTQAQLRKDGEIVGVLEYDIIQDLDSLEDILGKYAQVLNDEMKYYKEQFRNLRRTKYSIENLIGSSKKMEDLRKQIELAAASNSTVVVTGETGTGKELVAHSIHNLSNRKFGSFVKINAANLPETLAESELFGYEDGAFTGAKKGGKRGKFELANEGTLFIDEISQLPIVLQPKLLRALQEKEIDRLGGQKSISVNVRIIAATNENLKELVRSGRFREDLYYRLDVFSIDVPPLRERLEDLPELVMYRIEQLNLEMGKNITAVEDQVYSYLRKYEWPGNVRELYNIVEKAMNYAEGNVLKLGHFRPESGNGAMDLGTLNKLGNPIEVVKREAERKLIMHVLEMYQGNKSKAAEYLKIPRPLLYQKMKRLGINK
ncbi:sigma-54 interaction domain-containing protein [Sinanaerobacter chloroacetimidivorans]|jgi:transcriptional regulator with PAS, ATPase and Fis domain|uniref:Sigma 54-interacting transcriptional regulator n=1 Tax=Sinanaerobacter chloroacetimidivorans TaxID=2818044 RepID=A0A8J7W2U9_9FIRM|nr:sigma 54-interacting transcriptional regulator [Sinanaerobacter chloroacetimidivorans]MBR0599449.1 sigma 54-interacting transcriptional regulator [Sinanaerobacter chloroacetimidivorans]